jgi:hypothetical protein
VRGTSYIFKPSKKLTDRVARAVMDLYKHDMEINISQFYEYSVEKALKECEADPPGFAYKWKIHTGTKKPEI